VWEDGDERAARRSSAAASIAICGGERRSRVGKFRGRVSLFWGFWGGNGRETGKGLRPLAAVRFDQIRHPSELGRSDFVTSLTIGGQEQYL
jgi:hypothetical protein